MITAVILLAGCKPTERNYQAAYDKAYEAAQRRTQEQTTGSDGTTLEMMDGPRILTIDNETFHISSSRVSPFELDGDKPEKGTVGVAVARYSMPTNARRHAQELKKDFTDTFIVTDGDDNYYVVAIIGATIEETVPDLKKFKSKHKDYTYIGLSGHPLIFYF